MLAGKYKYRLWKRFICTIREIKSGLSWEVNPDCGIQQLLIVTEKLMYKNLASKHTKMVDFTDSISVELMIEEFTQSLRICLEE